MRTRPLGPFTVSAIGLGAMPLSRGDASPTEREAIATVHAALDAGVRFIDTADVYAPAWNAMGHNERLVGKAVSSWTGDRDQVVIGTKGGITRAEGDQWGRDGSERYLRSAVEASMRALGVEVIDLYQWHRPDRTKPYGDVVEVFAQLQQEGKIRAVGISNANIAEIDIAREVLSEGGLASVQNEFSPRYRSSEHELEHCEQHGISFLPWSPLGGAARAADVGQRYSAFGEIADDHGVSPQQVVLAWELSLGARVIPIPGSTRPASILDSVAAVELELTAEELARCSATG